MKPTDALNLLSVRSRNRLLRKYQILPEKIGEFEFYRDYLRHFEPYDFPMGHFEQESELRPLLQQLIAGSYQYDYRINCSSDRPRLHVNVVTEYYVLKGDVDAFTKKEIRQLTNHFLVEQFDKEAAVEEKKVSKSGLQKVREQRRVLWKSHMLEISALTTILGQPRTSSITFGPGTEEHNLFGITGKRIPLIDKYHLNMFCVLDLLFRSMIDLDTVALALNHISHLSPKCDFSEFFNMSLDDQTQLQSCYKDPSYPVDQTLVLERLAEWEQRFGLLTEKDVNYYLNAFGLQQTQISYRKMREERLLHTPERIKAGLDRSVIGQEHAKRQISMVMYMHLLRSGYQSLPNYSGKSLGVLPEPLALPRQNVLLTGPTGSGKSFILKLLCEMFRLPHITIDCASLTASGYVGRGLSDYFRGLHQQYSCDRKVMERAVIIFDEFDKISEMQIRHDSVGGVEIQQEFLVLLEGDEYLIEESKRSEQAISITTGKMMFVFSGSFHGIEKIIARRLSSGKSTLGFGRTADQSVSAMDPAEMHLHITTEDLISFGIIPELAGRVNHLIPLQQLTRAEYLRILKESDQSPLVGYRSFFTLHHHTLEISEEVYELLAAEAATSKTGARSLAPLVNKLLVNLLWQAAHETSTTYHIDEAYYRKVMR